MVLRTGGSRARPGALAGGLSEKEITMTANRGSHAAAFALAAGVCLIASISSAQSTQPAGAEGLAPMIPSEAFFYIERRGHQAVREVFKASNLGKMAADEAIKQFVNDSRVRIEQMIAKGILSLESPEEVAKYQKMLHDVLRPIWHNPSAMYLVLDKNFENAPGVGFICVTGKYRDSCRESLTAMIKVDVAGQDEQGKRHSFTYKKGSTIWQGVASHHKEFKLPKDPKKLVAALDDKTLFMTCWLNDILLIAMKLPAADAMSRMLSLTKPAKGKDADGNLQIVMKKTALKDWAFRWYLDAEAIRKAAKATKKADFDPFGQILGPLGIDAVRAVGGTEGYADNVYARKTYVYAPGGQGGLIRAFKRGGSYEKALAMIPDTSSMFLAGEFDSTAMIGVIQQMVKAQASSKSRADEMRKQMMKEMEKEMEAAKKQAAEVEKKLAEAQKQAAKAMKELAEAKGKATTMPRTMPVLPVPNGVPLVATRPASAPTTQIPEGTRKILAQVQALVEASDGNVGAFTTEMQGVGPAPMMGAMMMMGGPPFGVVLGLKDRDKALKAIDELVKLQAAKKDEDEDEDEGPDIDIPMQMRPKKPSSYRRVPIRYLGEMLRMAVLKDRVVIALSDNAAKLAIDAALDKCGGFAPDSKAQPVAKLCGKGPGIFYLDLSAMVKSSWPMLMTMAEKAPDDMPLASLPSTAKMARMLGPEIAVFQPDADGLLMNSRGKIPFATKFLWAYPMLMVGFMFMM